ALVPRHDARRLRARQPVRRLPDEGRPLPRRRAGDGGRGAARIAGPAVNGDRAPRRAWVALGVLALPCLLYAMDLTVLDLAWPRLAAVLHASAPELLWIVDVYGFLVAGSLLTMGSLGDRFGRRRLLLVGAACFSVASIAAAAATSAAALIASRALLGLAGA